MDRHAQASAFARDRLPSIPDSMIISDSEPESDKDQSKTRAGPSTFQARTKAESPKGFSTTKLMTEAGKEPSRRPPIRELSDDSDDVKVVENYCPPPAPLQFPQSTPQLATSTKSGPPPDVPSPIEVDSESSDSGPSPHDLSRFAYLAKPYQAQPRAITVESSTDSTRASPPPKRPSTREIHSATDFLTDGEVEKLARCVACNNAWTTQKTGSKKRYHLRLCQQRNGLTAETIRVLIDQELAKPVEEDRGKKGKGKAKEIDSPEMPVTLMDDVVHQAQPRKRGKRKEIPSTIIPIQGQYETVDHMAKRLFALESDDEDVSAPGPSNATSTTFPLTQEFPVSKFGNGKAFTTDPGIGLPSPIPSDDEEVGFYVLPCQETAGLQDAISISSDSESRASEGSSQPSSHGSGGRQRRPHALRQSLTPFSGGEKWRERLQRNLHTGEQQDFNAFMHEQIMRNDDLRLRVLRYEPVNITEFSRIADEFSRSADAGEPRKKLTDKLEAFLLSRAIHTFTPRN